MWGTMLYLLYDFRWFNNFIKLWGFPIHKVCISYEITFSIKLYEGSLQKQLPESFLQNRYSEVLLCNFIGIALQHECSPVNLLHIFRTPFPKNTSCWLLLYCNSNIHWSMTHGRIIDLYIHIHIHGWPNYSHLSSINNVAVCLFFSFVSFWHLTLRKKSFHNCIN